MTSSALRIEGLTIWYDSSCVADGLSIEVGDETAVLFGPSGCGKTSILKAILGAADPRMTVSGRVDLNGYALTRGNGDVGMVFQGPLLPGWMTTYDLCRMGNRIRRLPHTEQRKQIEAVLERFGIGHLAQKHPWNMSGGERQRVALAIALVNKPRVLLLDEPTTFLDGMARIAIWEFIETVVRPLGVPTVVVSHDPTEAVMLGDVIYLLSKPATVKERIDVPIPHPRHLDADRDPRFWGIRQMLATATE